MYEISIEKTFAAAHAIKLPDGSMEPVHGHNWQLTVTVASPVLDAIETVMDFHDLEKAVDQVIKPWHNSDLNAHPPFADGTYSPSAERVVWWVATQVSKALPEAVHLVSVSVTEAPGCTATYRPERA